jgi:hypothetical protein
MTHVSTPGALSSYVLDNDHPTTITVLDCLSAILDDNMSSPRFHGGF